MFGLDTQPSRSLTCCETKPSNGYKEGQLGRQNRTKISASNCYLYHHTCSASLLTFKSTRGLRDLNFANWPELEGPRRNSTSVSIACCGGRRSGGGGGEGCFFSFSRLPSQYFPSSLFLFVLSPLFGYRHIHYGIKSLYDYVKTRNTSQTSLH